MASTKKYRIRLTTDEDNRNSTPWSHAVGLRRTNRPMRAFC